MFDKKFNYKLEKQLTQHIIKLANYRNNLVHYKLSDTAGKLIMPPIKHTQLEDGGAISTIDFMAKPKRFEPPFVNSINSKSAVSGFNTALSVILKWGKLSGVDDCIPGLSIID
ncbi:hypothetical protein [Aurantivibrio plasticivorans]